MVSRRSGGGGEGFDFREGCVDGVEVLLFDGTGVDLFTIDSGEGGGEVLEEEREMEPVVDAEGGKDVEVVFGTLIGDDDGVGFEDGVGSVNGGVGDGEVGGVVGNKAKDESKDNAQNQEG